MNDLSVKDMRFRILRLLDGELDQAEVDLLDAELRKDPGARRLYLEYAQLHSALESRSASRAQIGQSSFFPMEKLLARQRRRMMQRSLLAAAAVVLMSLTILWMMVAQRKAATLASFEVAPNSNFSLTHSGDDHETRPNVLRAGSRLQLTSGVMEGKFDSGVRFVIEAPCDLKVLTEGRIAMIEGGGWFEVPSCASGFTVETGQMKVVDLGTRFGILAGKGKAHEIHVAKGSVEVMGSRKGDGKNKIVLKAGQALRLDVDGKFVEIPLDSSGFTKSLPEVPVLQNPGFESLENISDDRNPAGYGSIPNWGTSGNGVGSSNTSQPFLEGRPAHSGERVAFIQVEGAIAQSATGFDPAKLYTVTYFANERGLPGAAIRTSVSLDLGTSSYVLPDSIARTDAFRRIVSGPLHVFGTAANIEIRAQDHIGDAALLIDTVSISRAVPTIPDGGFENPAQPPRGFRQANGGGGGDLTGSAWKLSDGGGITANRSNFTPPTAPEGSQAAVLQNGSSIETTVTGFEPGVTYRLRLEAAGRTGGAAALRITLGGMPLRFHDSETLIPSTDKYQSFTSADFQAPSVTLPLLFSSASEGGSFIDDIRFDFVKEAP